VVNKWDTLKKNNQTLHDFEVHVREEFQYLDFEVHVREEFQYLAYAPIVFVSAKTHQRLKELPAMIKTVATNHTKRIKSSTLNEVIMDAIAMNPTPNDNGRRLRVYYATQVAIQPPTFVLFVNDPDQMHFSYERYLENQIREHFDFTGTPIHLIERHRK